MQALQIPETESGDFREGEQSRGNAGKTSLSGLSKYWTSPFKIRVQSEKMTEEGFDLVLTCCDLPPPPLPADVDAGNCLTWMQEERGDLGADVSRFVLPSLLTWT
ncbi:hypothetical protein F2Q69_00035858 [Brassica cretica]|uniref:Uncharacterized protein n=1 Tax=Brassica cretica TaxID=69181 RepID=A0A8S9SV38_BRACR|nr:hypothetical protein F2Q69_00035858 [Brassica cretica]